MLQKRYGNITTLKLKPSPVAVEAAAPPPAASEAGAEGAEAAIVFITSGSTSEVTNDYFRSTSGSKKETFHDLKYIIAICYNVI